MTSRPLVLVIVLIMMACSTPLFTAHAEATDPVDLYWDYPGRDKLINDFEGSALSSYGYWTMVNRSAGSASIGMTGYYYTEVPYEDPQFVVHGSKSLELRYQDYDVTVNGSASYIFRSIVDPLSIQEMSISLKLVDNDLTDTVYPMIIARSEDSGLHVLESQTYVLEAQNSADSEYSRYTFDDIWDPSAQYYQLEIYVATLGVGMLSIYVDYCTGQAPPSDVRFSYYNEYTGLGLVSELLIPEVWYEGTWQRVYGGHVVLGAGAFFAYRVTDFFGHVVTTSPVNWLNSSSYYIDVSVKLVKVTIAKPEWWDSSLPPEWYMTSIEKGTSITVSGWELEVLAGWYSFVWDTQTISPVSLLNTTEDIEITQVLAGSSQQYLDGNITSKNSYCMTDFFLSMSPTVTSIAGTGGTVIDPDLLSWQGINAAFTSLADGLMNSELYRAVMVIGFIFTLAGVVFWLKRRAAKALKLKGGN